MEHIVVVALVVFFFWEIIVRFLIALFADALPPIVANAIRWIVVALMAWAVTVWPNPVLYAFLASASVVALASALVRRWGGPENDTAIVYRTPDRTAPTPPR